MEAGSAEKKKVSLFKRERQESRQPLAPAPAPAPAPSPPAGGQSRTSQAGRSSPAQAVHNPAPPPVSRPAQAHTADPGKSDASQQRFEKQPHFEAKGPAVAEQRAGVTPATQREHSRPIEPGQESLEQKIERYHRFVDENLRVKLEKALATRGEVVKKIEEYEKLRGSVELLTERKTRHVKTQINVGCDVYMQAAVPDTSRIMVSIGLGLFAEFTLKEALEFIDVKCGSLQKRADELGQEAAQISSNIEVVLKGIQELMALPDPEPESSRRQFL